jgi:23S rRNA (cytosine1962-C5)-methyltransferase
MDIRLPLICDVLESMFHPRGIVERNESPLRSLENLPARKGILRGSIAPVTFLEHGLSYTVDLLEGQKTGFFLDQRENRASIRRFSRNARVLDCFCNDGGFALNAAQAGALSVLGIDSSGEAILRAKENARRNAISVATFEQDDVFQRLQTISSTGEQFDLIVLDPPSFTRSRKNVQSAKKGYRDLHESAFRTLRKDGMLLTASCSHHIEPDVFLNIVNDSARRVGKSIQLLDWRGAAPDHPTLPGVPETRYLKFGIFRTH